MPDSATLQRQLNAALAERLPRALRTHLQRLAIDLTLIPYHGQPFHDLNEIYLSQAKDGTSHFHSYATADVIRKAQRYPLATTRLPTGDLHYDCVQPLRPLPATARARPRLPRPDRAF